MSSGVKESREAPMASFPILKSYKRGLDRYAVGCSMNRYRVKDIVVTKSNLTTDVMHLL